MERWNNLRIFVLLTINFYIKQVSGSLSNLRVTDLGSETLEVSWDITTASTFSATASISAIDDRTPISPQLSTSTSAKWMRVEPGKKYEVKVGLFNNNGIEVSSMFLYVTTMPAAPENIRVTNFVDPFLKSFRVSGSRTIVYPVFGAFVSWDQHDIGEYDDFEITVNPPDGDIRVPVVRKNGRSTQDETAKYRIVWDLTPGVLYEYRVRSKSNGVFSTPINVFQRMPPETPTRIQAGTTTPTSVVLSWSGEHRGILDNYIVETEPDGGLVTLVDGEPTNPSRRVSNLTPGTKYTAKVFSMMDNLWSVKPSTKEFYTPPAVPLGDVTREQVKSESVFITWKRPQGKLDYYEVVYYPTDRDFGRLRERVWEPRHNLTTLDPGSSYRVEIYSVSNDLYSQPLREIVYTRPLPPNEVSATARQNTVEIQWTTQYFDGETIIKYYLESEDGVVTTKTLPPGVTETTITDLESESRYVISVSMVKNSVESDPVNVTVVTSTTTSSDETRFTPESPGVEQKPPTTTRPSTRSTKLTTPIEEAQTTKAVTTQGSISESTTSTTERTEERKEPEPAETTARTTASTTTSTQAPTTTSTEEATTTTTTTTTAPTTTTTTTQPTTTTTSPPRTTTTKEETTSVSTTPSSTSTTEVTTRSTTLSALPRRAPESTPSPPETTSEEPDRSTERVAATDAHTPSVTATPRSTTTTESSSLSTISRRETEPTPPPLRTTSEQPITTTKTATVTDTQTTKTVSATPRSTIATDDTTPAETATEPTPPPLSTTRGTVATTTPQTITVTDNYRETEEITTPANTVTRTDSVASTSTRKSESPSPATDATRRDLPTETIPAATTTSKADTAGQPTTMPELPLSRNEATTGGSAEPTTKSEITSRAAEERSHATSVATEARIQDGDTTTPATGTTRSTTPVKPITEETTSEDGRPESETTTSSKSSDPSTSTKESISTTAKAGAPPGEVMEWKEATTAKTIKVTSEKETTTGTRDGASTAILETTTVNVADSTTTTRITDATASNPIGSNIKWTTTSMTQGYTTPGPSIQQTTAAKRIEDPTITKRIGAEPTTKSIGAFTTGQEPNESTSSGDAKHLPTTGFTTSRNARNTPTVAVDEDSSEEYVTGKAVGDTHTTASTARPTTNIDIAVPPTTESSQKSTIAETSARGLVEETTIMQNTVTTKGIPEPITNKTIEDEPTTRIIADSTTVEYRPTGSSTTNQSIEVTRTREIVVEPTTEKNIQDTLTSTPQPTTIEKFEFTTTDDTKTTTNITSFVEVPIVTVPIDNGFTTLCEPHNMTVLVNKSIIEKYEKEYGPLQFNGGCRGVEHEDYYRYSISPIKECGTQIITNETHVNFTNTLSNRESHNEWYLSKMNQSAGLVIGDPDEEPHPLVHLHIHCTFPMDLGVSAGYLPDLRSTSITFNVSGVGKFAAIMQLYRDDKYQFPYYSVPSLPINGLMRVGITLLKTRDEGLTIATRKCWATPNEDPEYHISYPLIDEFCVIKGALGGKLRVVENAQSIRSRFEGPVFKFIGHAAVWLHCEIRVCFGDSCDTDCTDDRPKFRRKRDTSSVRGGPIVSAGPIHRQAPAKEDASEDLTDIKISEDIVSKDTLIIVVAAALITIVMLLSIIIVIAYLKCRRTSSDKEAITKSSFDSSSLDGPYNAFENSCMTEREVTTMRSAL